MSQTSTQNRLYILILTGILLAAIGGVAYLYYQTTKQADAIALLNAQYRDFKSEKDQQLADANNTISDLSVELNQTNEELAELDDDYRKEKNKNDEFEEQIRKITGTVADLDKLSKTDKELLQKYSKVYFLNENFVPSDIDKIDDEYIQDGKDEQYFHADALPFLERMLDRAERAGHDIRVVSAYRSFDEQTQLKGQFTQVYGSGANTFSADQGYSEHQLGTTVDLTTDEVGGTFPSFADTEAYEWLLDNAYKYGFVLSYPEGNSFYVFEPWHWRFVGEELAGDLNRTNASFYDWEQRKIDEYLLNIFD